MGRYKMVIRNEELRDQALNLVKKAPINTHLEFRRETRSLEQNSLLWAKLGEVSKQAKLRGETLDPEDWKTLFLVAMGKEMRIAPALDGNGFTPLGVRSSKLTIEEMSELIDFIDAWGAQNGVVFGDQQRDAA